jgi:hypothetical protein
MKVYSRVLAGDSLAATAANSRRSRLFGSTTTVRWRLFRATSGILYTWYKAVQDVMYWY